MTSVPPLASIRAMVESLSDGIVTDEETVARYLRRTVNEVESLGQLINDLFELSQLDSGHLDLHIEMASLDDLISDTLESMSAQATAKRVGLAGSVSEGQLQIVMDTRRVQRALQPCAELDTSYSPRRYSQYRCLGRWRSCTCDGYGYWRRYRGVGSRDAVRPLLSE